ncbi:MAG: anhydro-N-acetylmuramic acid kinase [Alphaproteobacteria bacterium]|nr:anhydro-N-acetylmuramic acid kinase [Alphaproteobacteria bacterium]
MKINITKPFWAIGLMSGTSADGIDAALIQTDGISIQAFGATHYAPYSQTIRQSIHHAYGSPPESDQHSLERAITEHHAEAVFALLDKANLRPEEIKLIGFHGQTLFHNPPKIKGEIGETYSIGDGHLLASLSGIVVIDQLRLNDIAHGGQGAPLVPIFHQAMAKNLPKPTVIVNIGGVSNMTWIGEHDDDLLAFDMGPGNGLIDDWVRENTDLPWDEDGKIADQGHINTKLLADWLAHPYFQQTPPKALDRKTFNVCLEEVRSLPFEDGVATLTAFTVECFEKALNHCPKKPQLCLIAGGGAHNSALLKMMREKSGINIQKSFDMGWNGDALEAQAFGFLAVRSFKNLPLSFPGTTGAPYPLSGGRMCEPKSGLEISHAA